MTCPIHQAARTRIRFRLDGFLVAKDEHGHTGFTRLHDNGHVHTRAAIANVLRHAAAARHIPSDHAHFLEKARQLRKYGTWL
jgi:hypothetical protein